MLCHLVASEWVVLYVLLSTVWVSVDVRFSCTVSLAEEDAEIAICVLAGHITVLISVVITYITDDMSVAEEDIFLVYVHQYATLCV